LCYLLWFTDERTPPGQPIADASEFTFYSAVTNIDLELNEWNPMKGHFVLHSSWTLGPKFAVL